MLSRWISADPILEKYLPSGDKNRDQNLPGIGGIFNPFNLGLYSYAHLNPIMLLDLWGEETFGTGIEVPKKEAIKDGTLDLSVDTGHTYVYVVDKEGKKRTTISFGPGERIGRENVERFREGKLPGTINWPIHGKRTEYETEITPEQYKAALKWMDDLKKNTPNYTIEVNCTTVGVLGAKATGISLPEGAGIGPVIYPDIKFLGITVMKGYKGNVYNPYALDRALSTLPTFKAKELKQ